MAYYPEEWVEEVRQRSDIVEVVQEYMPLKPNGKRHWGLCPFHSEKTPSFSVHEEKQLYYCFGCHAGGNVFRFVMEQERMEFPEAIRHLAERAHMEIPQGTKEKPEVSRERKERLYEVMTQAARYYNALLYMPQSEKSLQYVHDRGLGDNTIRKFGIGTTDQGWDLLTKHLLQLGYTQQELNDANLSTTREDRSFDVFRSRIMFPIFDQRGRVTAFGGRILGEGQPKYLNTSDTPIFNKRRSLYGQNFIKGTLTHLYLVEGYMDVISLYQHGITGCVATLGTAITSEQARLMRRTTGEVIIVYDGDAAGQAATEKALSIFETQGVMAKVAVIPGNADPDDYVRKYGGQAFAQMPLLSATAYRLSKAKLGIDFSSQEGRTHYADKALVIIKQLQSPLEIENHIKDLMIETGFSKDVLYEQMGRSVQKREKTDIDRNTHDRMRDTKEDRHPDYVKAQQHLLSLMVSKQGTYELPISIEDFTDPLCREMAEIIFPTLGDPLSASRAVDNIEEDDKRSRMIAILQLDEDCEKDQQNALIKDYLRSIQQYALEMELKTLTLQIEGLRPTQAPDLFAKYMQVDAKLARLRRKE